METYSFVFSFTTMEGLFNDLKHFSENFDPSALYRTNELYSEGNRKVVSKISLESSPENEVVEAEFFRRKSYFIKKTIELNKGVWSPEKTQ